MAVLQFFNVWHLKVQPQNNLPTWNQLRMTFTNCWNILFYILRRYDTIKLRS